MNESESIKAKYFDDISIAVQVLLNEFESGGKKLQKSVDELQNFTDANGMRINENKSKVMLFSRSKNLHDIPDIGLGKNKKLEVINRIKLLGVMVSENLKWDLNTEYICSKARKRIFLLRNMKLSGLNTKELIDAYKKEVRSLIEFAVPVWNSGLTLDQIRTIERVQKSSLSAILGHNYTCYEDALKLTKLDRLSTRRRNI